jgi:hypothetical protein
MEVGGAGGGDLSAQGRLSDRKKLPGLPTRLSQRDETVLHARCGRRRRRDVAGKGGVSDPMKPVDADADTAEAVEDWIYRVAMGYEF